MNIDTTPLKKYAPEILTGVSIVGLGATAFLSIRGYKKASKRIEAAQVELSTRDKIRLCWVDYLPAVTVGLATTGAIVGSNRLSAANNTALGAAYFAATSTIKEMDKAIAEELGKGKANKIKDLVAEKKLEEKPIIEDNVIIVGDGESLFFDSWTGRYFKSNIETVKRIQNDFNHALIGGSESFVTLNEVYSAIGLERIKSGDNLGWTPENPIEVGFSTQLTTDGRPCAVLNFLVEPGEWTW